MEKNRLGFYRKKQRQIKSGKIRNIPIVGHRGEKYELSDLAGMCGGKDGGLSFGGREVRKVNGKEKVYYPGGQQEVKDEGECLVRGGN